MLTPPRLPSHLSFNYGSWRLVKKVRKSSAVPSEDPAMGQGSPKLPPHTYCTDGEPEAQRGSLAWSLLSHLDV